jgi:hypothetical protein
MSNAGPETHPIGKAVPAGLVAGLVMLLAACAGPPGPERVADQFVQAYFIQSDMATAVKLASGSAKAKLTAIAQQIESAGAREPAKDQPRVKVALVEKRPVSAGAFELVYRVESDVQGIAPITATLQLAQDGNAWHVSEFSQSP